jgi:phosphoesterase family protein
MVRVVVLMQENKTPDFYFPTLSAWGANIQNRGKLLTTPPIPDPRHDRDAWVHYKMGDYAPTTLQIDNDVILPFYSWLAKQFTYCDYHFGLGTNSTPGHMLAVGGQTPTLRNPPSGTAPVWDLPTIFKHVEAGGRTWGAFTGSDLYPLKFYQELSDPASRQKIHTSTLPSNDAFTTMAAAGTLPEFCFAWGPAGYDEHAPDQTHNPRYVTDGHNLTWQRVDAVVRAGGWADTVFILSWDDWGGYADHVATPNAETVVDALHPAGFQLIGGSRIPMLMFGGRVKQGIDITWHSHAVIPKTVIDLFALAPFGVSRVDTSASLVGRVDQTLVRPAPPSLGSTIVQPPAPNPTPAIQPPTPWGGPNAQPLPPLVANGGKTIPAPNDAVVSAKPPKLPTGL